MLIFVNIIYPQNIWAVLKTIASFVFYVGLWDKNQL